MSHPHASHLKSVGILHIVLGILGMLLVAVFALLFVLFGGFLLVSNPTAGGDAGAAGAIVAVVGLVFFVVSLVLSLPAILGGWGVMKGKSWGRVLILIVSALNLLSFPLGTLIAVYSFWTLLHTDTEAAMLSLNEDTNLYS